ncbi:MAG: hypothetical protein AB7I30_12035 [Isosphaeraceae bacterium]
MTSPDSSNQDPFRREFPPLPIVTPEPDRLSQTEKYGGLFYLGLAGLVLSLSILGWFAWGVWSTREIWRSVYVLHDPQRTEDERVQAAYALSRSVDVNQRQLWDVALRRDLPPLARYVVAEGLTAEAVAADPKAYGAAVARSEGWPDWLRLILTRPMVYTAAIDRPVPRESLIELTASPSPALVLLARFALAASSAGDPESEAALREAAERGEGELRGLAEDLVQALDGRRLDQKLIPLDRATIRLRTLDPAAPLWRGWEVQGETLRRVGPKS